LETHPSGVCRYQQVAGSGLFGTVHYWWILVGWLKGEFLTLNEMPEFGHYIKMNKKRSEAD
jgi:hypothetical protein